MPRKPREYLLRYHGQVINHLQRSQEKLAEMYEMYVETHKEHADYCISTGQAIEFIKTELEDFKKKYM